MNELSFVELLAVADALNRFWPDHGESYGHAVDRDREALCTARLVDGVVVVSDPIVYARERFGVTP